MRDNRVQFFDEPHVMQPGSVAGYLRDFASHLAAQGYQSLSISNCLWPALHFGDIRKVALWLGHASALSTEIDVRADPSEKLEALVTITPPTLRRGRFTPPDKLLALLRPEKR